MDGVMVLGLALLAGGYLIVAPVAVLGAALGIIVLVPSQRRKVAALVGAGLVVGGLRAGAATADFAARAKVVDSTSPRLATCTARAQVSSSPTLGHGVLRYSADLSGVECEGGPAARMSATLYGGPDDLARGDTIDVVARLAPPEPFNNPDVADPRPGSARRAVMRTGGAVAWQTVHRGVGPLAWIDAARAHVRARIAATFPHETEPMARALVLGESDLDPEDDAAFRASGLSHLLAVSGMHLVLVVVGAVRALRGLLVRFEMLSGRTDVWRIASALGVPIAWAYADFAGGSGSARRAAWMLTFGLLPIVLGRRPSPQRAFALSLVGAAYADPLAAFDVSFVLSVAATGGLLGFSRPMTESLTKRLPSWTHAVVRSLATTLAATLPCAPILATFAPTLPLGGVLANLIAVPVGEAAALPLCLLHGLLSPWSEAEQGAGMLGSGALHLVRLVARASASASFAQIEVPRPTPIQLAALTFAMAAWLLVRGGRRWCALAAGLATCLVAEVAAIRAGAPPGVLRATFMDVAQGDGTLVDLPDGSAMLIDGGGLVGSPVDLGTRVIAPMLRARRRGELAVVVLSHPHPDHAGGLATGLDRIRVREAWDTGQGEREGVGGAYATFLTAMRSRKTPISRPPDICGKRSLGGAEVEVLAPCPESLPERSPNDNSIVLRIRYGSRSLLFVGDAEREEERSILEGASRSLRADVLKVGHHGSRTSSSTAFIAAVHPEVAVISCGIRNRFGHPAPGTVHGLQASGARLFRTDRDGAVVVTTDGSYLTARSAVDGLPEGLYSPLP